MFRAGGGESTNAQGRRAARTNLRSLGLAMGVLMVVSAVACGDGSYSEEERAKASVAIYATVTRQIVEFDNTFGPDYRFTEVLVLDRVVFDAADYMTEGSPGDALTDEQRSAIAAAIEDLSPVTFVSNRSDFIQQEVLMPVIPGSAIVTLAPVEFDGAGATVGVNLWCGGTCGIWLTYRVTKAEDGWTVTGTEGDMAIS